MTVIQFAEKVLPMGDDTVNEAITRLRVALVTPPTKWNNEHRNQVRLLAEFLESGSKDIADLKKHFAETKALVI